MLLYKKKDIIAIQKKLGMLSDQRKGPIENIYQTALNQSKKGKTLEDFITKFLTDLETTNEVSNDRYDDNALWFLGQYVKYVKQVILID